MGMFVEKGNVRGGVSVLACADFGWTFGRIARSGVVVVVGGEMRVMSVSRALCECMFFAEIK